MLLCTAGLEPENHTSCLADSPASKLTQGEPGEAPEGSEGGKEEPLCWLSQCPPQGWGSEAASGGPRLRERLGAPAHGSRTIQ